MNGSRPARILLVTDSLEIGGAERHVADLATALHRASQDVRVACSAGGPLYRGLEAAGVPVHVLMPGLVKRRVCTSYASRLGDVLSDWHPDLIHAHQFASATAAAFASRRSGIPLVLTEHSEGFWKGARAWDASMQPYAQAHHIVAVSESIRRRLQARGVPEHRVSVIRNAVRSSNRARYRRALHAYPTVAVVARLQPEKGVHVFLEAMALVAPTIPQARFLIVGDGPMRPSLLEQTSDTGLGSQVRFLGMIPNVRVLLPALDAIVVPSLTEGTPLITLEAISAGVPIVATRAGGIPEQLEDGIEALLVPPADPEALARATCSLLHDRSLGHRLARAAQQRVERSFRHAEMVRHIRAVYGRVLAEVGTEPSSQVGTAFRRL